MSSVLRFLAFSLAAIGAAVGGCAATGAGPGDAGSAGGGGSIVMTGVGGTGGGAGATGTAGTTGCATPPTAHMSWKFSTGDASGPFETCAQLGATTLDVFMNEAHSQFTCTAYGGTTGPLMAGSYTPRLIITSAQGNVLANDTFPNPITVPSCGVDELGVLVIIINAGSTTGAAGSTGGAGGTTGAAGSTGTAGAGGSTGGTGPCNALPIFATHQCSVMNACHDSKGTAAGFDMQTTGWQNTLVGRTPKAGGGAGFTSQCLTSGMPYLVAGSAPARGLFLEKLMPNPPCGSEMPALGSTLSSDEMSCVQRWANGLVSGK
jgi:hypothetical protein